MLDHSRDRTSSYYHCPKTFSVLPPVGNTIKTMYMISDTKFGVKNTCNFRNIQQLDSHTTKATKLKFMTTPIYLTQYVNLEIFKVLITKF